MKKSTYFIFAVYVGIQSFLLQLVDQLIGSKIVDGGHSGFVFVAFQAWALYFLLGSSLKGGVKGFCGYALGIIFAVIMIVVAGVFAAAGILALPITALIVVPFMMYFEFAPWCLRDTAAFFIGAGAFFGIHNYVSNISIMDTTFVVLLYCFFGLFSGWATSAFRKWFEKQTEKKNTQEVNLTS